MQQLIGKYCKETSIDYVNSFEAYIVKYTTLGVCITNIGIIEYC